MLLTAASALGPTACGGSSDGAARARSEVRALFANVAAQGRAHDFTAICRREMSGLLLQLDHLVNASCPEDLAAEWAEGVQLTHVGPSTRIEIEGKTATVLDGGSPDRAYLLRGRWVLSELPRNKRHAQPNEALEVAREINPGLRKDHLPELDEETPAPPRAAGS